MKSCVSSWARVTLHSLPGPSPGWARSRQELQAWGVGGQWGATWTNCPPSTLAPLQKRPRGPAQFLLPDSGPEDRKGTPVYTGSELSESHLKPLLSQNNYRTPTYSQRKSGSDPCPDTSKPFLDHRQPPVGESTRADHAGSAGLPDTSVQTCPLAFSRRRQRFTHETQT